MLCAFNISTVNPSSSMSARYCYTVLFYLLMPLVLLRLAYRGLRAPAYRSRIAERFGFSPTKPDACIWVHAVSVGETIAAVPFIRALQAQLPQTAIVVTTMTPTGSERVKAMLGDSVWHVYAPYDLPGSIARFLRCFKPSLMVIMETELWPNTIAACRKNGIPVVLANARLSEKSARGYARLSALTQPMLQDLSKVVAQSQADAQRFIQLGLSNHQVTVSGSIKFDIDIADATRQQAAQLKNQWTQQGARPIWLAASTHQGEDEIVLRAYKKLLEQDKYKNLLLVLVPRHPERFDRVARLAVSNGFNTERKSASASPADQTQVFIGDTMGELMLMFGCADMVFVGGSLVNKGGHNMLEPAAWGLPMVTGDSDFNFLAISEKLQASGALVKASNSTALAQQIDQWLQSDVERKAAGEKARSVIDENRGALQTLLQEVTAFL